MGRIDTGTGDGIRCMGFVERNESTKRSDEYVCRVCGASFQSEAAHDQHVREKGFLY